jgi:hypothetical protein
MKIKVDDDRYFPTLGVWGNAGDEIEVPEEAFPSKGVVDSKLLKTAKNESVVTDDGSTPQ